MKRPRRTFRQWVRSHRVFAAVAAVAIVVGGYALWSVMSWQQFQERYETALVDMKTRIDTTLALPQKTNEEKNHKMTSLAEMVNKEASMNCQMNGMFDWQKVFGGIQAKVDDCLDKAEKLSALREALENVAVYLQDEQALVGKMRVDIPSDIKEGDFEAQVASWQQIRSDVESLTVSEAFKPVKTKAQEASDAIHAAWQRLIDAHKAKDQTAYEESRAKLPESYDTLAAIASTADAQLVDLTKTLQATYSTLYS